MAAHDSTASSNELSGRDFSSVFDEILGVKEISSWLNSQSFSADAKALLAKVAEVSTSVGATILPIGRKVISTIAHVINIFPGTAFGVVVGGVLSFLIGSIPLIGAVLAPFLSPILLAFGIGMGAVADFQSMRLKSKMEEIAQQYSPLVP